MLLPTTYASRWPVRLGLLTMLVLLVMSWYFYLERAAYSDLGFHVLVNIQTKTFFIQNRRIAQAPTQVLPLLAIWAGTPLNALLRIFSLSFTLYYLLVYALSAYWLRNERAALLMPLALILVASSTFYWPQAELAQTMGALLLAHAAQSRQAPLRLNVGTLAIAVLIVAGIFGHPMGIFVFLFLWAYDWLQQQRWRDKTYYLMLAVGLLTYIYRANTVPPGSYEDVGAAFMHHLSDYYPDYLSLPEAEEFRQLVSGSFLAVPLILLALTAYNLWQRSWLALARLGLVWAAVLGYALIVIVWNPGVGDTTYTENLYLPMGVFVGAPLVYELLPALENRLGARGPLLAAGVLALVLAVRLVFVYQVHRPFTAYQRWLAQVLTYVRAFPERRFVIDDVNGDPTHLRVGTPWWASPYETLLLSARASPDSAQSVYVCNEMARFTDILNQKIPGLFLGPYHQMSSWDLPLRYFRIPSPEQAYRLLNTPPPADEAALPAYIEARRQTTIELVDFPQTLKADYSRTVRVLFKVPTGGQPLHSGLHTAHPTLVRTRFESSGNWPDPAPPVEIPLEVDVWHPWQQELPLNCPAKPGKYILDVSLFSKDYRDWPTHLRVPVEVK